jgi:hypothetical protein
MSPFARLAVLGLLLTAPVAAQAQDAIVGTWVGTAKSGENTFDTQLTFVSPKGGISRYPGIPCGGLLAGDRKGDAYEYTESVTWGGLDEKPDGGCVPGSVNLTVNGDKMQYEWTGKWPDGQDYTATGELQRVKKR